MRQKVIAAVAAIGLAIGVSVLGTGTASATSFTAGSKTCQFSVSTGNYWLSVTNGSPKCDSVQAFLLIAGQTKVIGALVTGAGTSTASTGSSQVSDAWAAFTLAGLSGEYHQPTMVV
jgi:hypothetical protein